LKIFIIWYYNEIIKILYWRYGVMDAIYFVSMGSLLGIIFAWVMFLRVKKQPEGTSEMARISEAVRKGANAYLRRQYSGVAIFFIAHYGI
jgi:K(+)-stimulated pyrophosphate-energized sodium pump